MEQWCPRDMDAEEKMEPKLYNTMTQARRKEGFDPFTPGKVGLYVCAYDFSHMGGHARADVLYRSRSMISILPPSLVT